MTDDAYEAQEQQKRIDALARIGDALRIAHDACSSYTDEFTDEPEGFLSKTWETVHSIGAALQLVAVPIVEHTMRMLDQSSCDNCDELHPGDHLVIVGNDQLCEACVIAELLRLRREQSE